jgi:hypothetical protein
MLTRCHSGVTITVNDCGADVLTPPFAVPPLSLKTTVMIALPTWFGAGVNCSVPSALRLGIARNRSGFVFPSIVNCTVWLASFAGPAAIPVAQVALYGPLFGGTMTSGPFVNDGASLTWSTAVAVHRSTMLAAPCPLAC